MASGPLPFFLGLGEKCVGDSQLFRLTAFPGVLEFGFDGFQVSVDGGEFGFLALDYLGGTGPSDHDVLQEFQLAREASATFLQTGAFSQAIAKGAAGPDEFVIGGHVASDAVNLRVDVIHGLLVLNDVIQSLANFCHGIPGI